MMVLIGVNLYSPRVVVFQTGTMTDVTLSSAISAGSRDDLDVQVLKLGRTR